MCVLVPTELVVPVMVVVVLMARVSGGMTETSSTTSPRDAWRVTDTDVKFWPKVSEYWFVHVDSFVALLNVQDPLVVAFTVLPKPVVTR